MEKFESPSGESVSVRNARGIVEISAGDYPTCASTYVTPGIARKLAAALLRQAEYAEAEG